MTFRSKSKSPWQVGQPIGFLGSTTIYALYVHAFRSVLRKPRSLGVFCLASSMHAVGHALLGLMAGTCARVLVAGWGKVGARSTTVVWGWWAGGATPLALSFV